MNQSVGQVAIVVRDYDEALSFYMGTLGFKLIEDTPVPYGTVAVFKDLYGNLWDLVQPRTPQP
jgi:catechol 2,3-dioxygenase-like lactoylglutathione lyase family enzyme